MYKFLDDNFSSVGLPVLDATAKDLVCNHPEWKFDEALRALFLVASAYYDLIIEKSPKIECVQVFNTPVYIPEILEHTKCENIQCLISRLKSGEITPP